MKPTREKSEREISAQEQDDITMTQEELADDVRWEETAEAPEERSRSRKAAAAPVLAKRSHSTLIKNISKKPKRSGRSVSSNTNSIEDIMGILDGVQAVDKENSLQFNSHPGAAVADAVGGNEDAEIFSATATLSGNTVCTVEHDLAVEAAPAVPVPQLIAAPDAGLNEYDAAVATLAGLEDMTQMLRAGTTQSLPPPANVPAMHAAQDPYFAATQTWENNGFGFEIVSSTKGFCYASTGTARPTPADPPTLLRSRSELGATGAGYAVTTAPIAGNHAKAQVASSSAVNASNAQKHSSSAAAAATATTRSVDVGCGKITASVAASSSAAVRVPHPPTSGPAVQVPSAPHPTQQTPAHVQQPHMAAPSYSQQKANPPIRPANAPMTMAPPAAGGYGLTQRPSMQLQPQIPANGAAHSHNNHTTPRPPYQPAQPQQPTALPTAQQRMHHQPQQQQQELSRSNNQQWAHPPSMPEKPLFASTSARNSLNIVGRQQLPATVSQVHVLEPLELSEEALAQLLELERAATEAPRTLVQQVNPPPSSSIAPLPSQAIQIELSDADLARLLELEQSAMAQEHPAASATALSQQCGDVTLTDDVLAQLLELEMAAMAQMNTTDSTIVGANAPTAVPGTSSSSGAAGPSSTTVSSTLLCMRLVALDVVDNHITRTKEVQAFQPGGDDVLRDSNINDARNGASRRNGRIDTVEDTFSELVTVELTGDWYNCPIVSGDIFHVVDLGPEEPHTPHHGSATPLSIFSALRSTKRITVTDSWGLVVTQPDILVSPTKVAESCNCIRRGVLTDRVRSFGDLSAPAVLGNLKHAFIEALTEKLLEILQALPQQQNVHIQQVRSALSRDTIYSLMATAKADLVEELFLVGCTDESVTAELSAFVEPTVAWVFTMYTQGVQALQQGVAGAGRSNQVTTSAHSGSGASGTSNGGYSQRNNAPSGSHTIQKSQSLPPESTVENVNYRMTAVTNAEETVWSAVLGMKGQMDLLAKAKIGLLASFPASLVRELMEYTLPVELKTGKWRPSTVIGHRAQVILYVVMMAIRERGGVSLSTQTPAMIPKHGLIVYLSPEETKVDLIKPSWSEVRALIMSRNKLATFIRDVSLGVNSTGASKSPLPPLLHSPFDCQYCYQASECMTYHAVDGGTATSSGVKELFSYVLKGITPSQLSYFKHWDELLNLEALATAAPAHSWTSASDKRRDKCVGGLTFQSCQSAGDAANTRYLIIFSRDVVTSTSNADLTVTAEELIDTVAESEDALPVSPAAATLAVNDRVQVSVEASSAVVDKALRRCKSVSTSGGASSSSDLSSTDIEDMGGMFRSNSEAVMFTDANVTSGFIELITATEVHVVVSEDPKRFKQLYSVSGAGNWKFWINKDEITINITTMRSNLLALFVQPFRPKDFQQAKALEARKAKEGTSSNTAVHAGGPESREEAPANTRWRQLIVDLASPRFRSPGNLQDELLLMRPLNMMVGIYQQALKMLFQYLQLGGQSLEMSRQQLGHLGVSAAAIPVGNGAVTCVSKGPAGELHVFGGLTVYPGCNPFALAEEFKTLNAGQAAAVRKILLAQDYALLLGLPGTGKTSTLSLVIRMMVCRGQMVLLTSFTHSAVDHLLMKLTEAGMQPAQAMRIGSKNSIHPDVQRFALDCRSDLTDSVSALQHYLQHVRLVACTVLAASRNQLVRSLSLDCCVMDEAGQIAQPAALGAVLAARTCVLVGDDYQLPPLVVSIEAQAKGMNVSLFKRFMKAHPAAVCSLTIQYRMNQEIMSVCNALIYEYRMQCAVPSIAQARIRLPQAHLIPLPVNTVPHLKVSAPVSSPRSDWLHLSLQANPAVVFLNTDNLACNLAALLNPPTTSNSQRGAGGGNSISSDPEAHIVRMLITALLAVKFDLKNVGVICPFRAQVGLITSKIKTCLGEAALQDCEVSTVDKYQGRDKDVIILSTVKSCVDGGDSVGNLLRDWRRINVAITRAKHKLIVIGSFAIMQQVPVLQGFTRITQTNNWTIDLPPDALELYARP